PRRHRDVAAGRQRRRAHQLRLPHLAGPPAAAGLVAMTDRVTKSMMNQRPIALLVSCLLLAACTTTSEPQNGTCTVDQAITTDCNGTADGGASRDLGLTGYTCTGTARPDQTPSYAGGVPHGIICANQ